MEGETDSSLKAMAGAGAGSLLGALIGKRFPQISAKMFPGKISSNAIPIASSGIGAVLGASAGKDLVGNSAHEIGGGDLGLMVGAPLGALASAPFIRSSQRGKLLKYLLGTGLGSIAGVGAGTYVGSKLGGDDNG